MRVLGLVTAWIAIGASAGPAPAQPEAPAPEAALDEYLRQRGLNELLALRLRERLDAASRPDERVALAEQLAVLYVTMLEEAGSPEQVRAVEEHSTRLLESVPEAQTYELRINLCKARYVRAEQVAEAARLRRATPEEEAEAQDVLREVGIIFRDIGAKSSRLVESLEKRAERDDADHALVQRAVDDARRVRSLSMYYAGWCDLYTATLTRNKDAASDALREFGWLLNAGEGRPAAIDRLPEGNLRFAHVARAAIGCALACSILGQEESALRWLDAVQNAPDVPADVRAHLRARRITILAAARRWADLERLVRLSRANPDGSAATLTAPEARLLGVLTLEALRSDATRANARPMVQALADQALADLIVLARISDVRDLVSLFGTSPIGEAGFIVLYVRALQAYEHAVGDLAASGQDPSAPTRDEAIANRFRSAAGLFESALSASDAASFAPERTQAGYSAGVALFLAGDIEPAVSRLEQTFRSADAPRGAEDALWYAVVAATYAVEHGMPSMVPRRAALGQLYLQEFPAGERAAKLLLNQASDGLIAEPQAAEVLLRVGPESPLREAARRHAAGILYRLYRAAPDADRDYAALRFVEVAEEVMDTDERVALSTQGPESLAAAELVVSRIRQVLDALLRSSAPDLQRVRAAFDRLERVRDRVGLDLAPIEDELTFRRMQWALARGDDADAARADDELARRGGPFAAHAARALYRRALDAWHADPDALEHARAVVVHGRRLIDAAPPADSIPATSAALYSIVAEAASKVWSRDRDPLMRDIALELDGALAKAGLASAPDLERYAAMSEEAGLPAQALDAWRTLLAARAQGSDPWYRARYESLRLLAGLDAQAALRALDQHAILNPAYGPEPWGKRLSDLHDMLRRSTTGGGS